MDKKTLRHIAKSLRRGTLSWHGRNEALRNASKQVWEKRRNKKGEKIYKTYWQCANCLKWDRDSTKFEVDHKEEIGKMPDTLEELAPYAERMYNFETLQVLCIECHTRKTSGYNSAMRFTRKK